MKPFWLGRELVWMKPIDHQTTSCFSLHRYSDLLSDNAGVINMHRTFNLMDLTGWRLMFGRGMRKYTCVGHVNIQQGNCNILRGYISFGVAFHGKWSFNRNFIIAYSHGQFTQDKYRQHQLFYHVSWGSFTGRYWHLFIKERTHSPSQIHIECKGFSLPSQQ